MVDESTGGNYYPTPQKNPGMRPDGHAEFISEDPSGEAQPLADFGNTTFYQAQAYSSTTGWGYIGNLSRCQQHDRLAE